VSLDRLLCYACPSEWKLITSIFIVMQQCVCMAIKCLMGSMHMPVVQPEMEACAACFLHGCLVHLMMCPLSHHQLHANCLAALVRELT
jgi:hypothetical protein